MFMVCFPVGKGRGTDAQLKDKSKKLNNCKYPSSSSKELSIFCREKKKPKTILQIMESDK